MTVDDRIAEFKRVLPLFKKETLDILCNNGFFTAPASTKYHGAYEGGLFDHSLMVAKTLIKLTEKNDLAWGSRYSPAIVGMFHDLCKIDAYEHCKTGEYYDGTPIYDGTYERREDTLYKGHGEKSVILLSSYIAITPEEAACIRYHMGAFTDQEEWKYYTTAVKYFPNVLWTHHADMIASQIEGV